MRAVLPTLQRQAQIGTQTRTHTFTYEKDRGRHFDERIETITRLQEIMSASETTRATHICVVESSYSI